MVYLEDLVKLIVDDLDSTNRTFVLSTWDISFIKSVNECIDNSFGLSSKQLEIVKKIIFRNEIEFAKVGIPKSLLFSILDKNITKNNIRESINLPREVRYAGKRCLVFRFKFNDNITSDLKKTYSKIGINKFFNVVRYNKTYKVWIIEVSEKNLQKVMDLISKYSFSFNDEVVQFLTDCENSKGKDTFVSLTDRSIKLKINNNPLLTTWYKTIFKYDVKFLYMLDSDNV